MADGAPGRAAASWATLAERNPAVGVVDTLLRGVGQVMFQNNPLTGLLFLVGILVNSFKFCGAGCSPWPPAPWPLTCWGPTGR